MSDGTRSPLPYTTLALALAVVTAPACSRMDADEEAASEAADSTEVTQNEAALVASGADDAATSLTAADLAAAASARAGARFQPTGCAAVTVSGTTVTTTLNDCTGRFGLLHVTGTVVSVFSDAADGVHVATTAHALAVNRATLDIDATATITESAGVRTLVVTTNGSGTGPRGHTFTRTGSYTVTRDLATSCITLDGQWQLGVAGASRTTTVSGVGRCDNGMCPEAGGTIVHTGFRGRTVTLTFNGTAVAGWSSSTGRSGTIDLTCGG
jgi:hypothetical protein